MQHAVLLGVCICMYSFFNVLSYANYKIASKPNEDVVSELSALIHCQVVINVTRLKQCKENYGTQILLGP